MNSLVPSIGSTIQTRDFVTNPVIGGLFAHDPVLREQPLQFRYEEFARFTVCSRDRIIVSFPVDGNASGVMSRQNGSCADRKLLSRFKFLFHFVRKPFSISRWVNFAAELALPGAIYITHSAGAVEIRVVNERSA